MRRQLLFGLPGQNPVFRRRRVEVFTRHFVSRDYKVRIRPLEHFPHVCDGQSGLLKNLSVEGRFATLTWIYFSSGEAEVFGKG